MIFTNKQDYATYPQRLSDNKTFIELSDMSFFGKLRFKLKLRNHFKLADKRLSETLSKKECFYGPFKGEFGHFLAHTLPFLMYLHKSGVSIHYCGMSLHKPFLVDEKGVSILASFHELRDFFSEVAPSSNSTIPPQDVIEEIRKFDQKAKQSGLPYWNIDDDFYYWFIHRNWLKASNTHIYNLAKYYRTKSEQACAIFPRSKGAASSHNNGESWDYTLLVQRLTLYFEKVYVVGHPSQVLSIPEMPKVELRITTNNAEILEAVSNSNLLITQHSGVCYLSEYANKQALLIYKGANRPNEIGSLNNTLRFREVLGAKRNLHFAFSEEAVIEYVSKKMYL